MSSIQLGTMKKTRNIYIERLEKFRQSGQFSDVNLHAAQWLQQDSKAVQLSVYSVPDLKRISFKEAVKGTFQPTSAGESFGPSNATLFYKILRNEIAWSTHWFKVSIDIPESFKGQQVLLIFDCNCEAFLWTTDGTPITGLTGGDIGERHVDYKLVEKATGREHYDFYIETACNGLFGAGAGWNGSIFPPENDRYYKLQDAKIAVRNELGYQLYRDFDILLGILKEMPSDSQLASDALYTANQIVNAFRYDVPESFQTASDISKEFFSSHVRAGSSLHDIVAIGHCHIDTAWLWPYDETKRKSARSWSTQCSLMDENPSYTFTASQAQQFEWTEELYPKLFERIKTKVDAGTFIPIGGTWVEMDCNLPSGEGLCRQFLYGQRYFESKFGKRCSVFWLPDTFGYAAQLPQIIRESDLKYFFTQKLSWNNINKFPHTTFMWKGLDGTSVLTHFSPADTYTAQATVRDVVFAVKNNKDKEYSNKSLLVYGNGDGGGGPLQSMLDRIDRMSVLEGLPATVSYGSPNDFYQDLEKTSKDLAEWKGELYFELHRGTYTSQANIKKGNRQSELLLRSVEIVSTLANILCNTKYPKSELDRLWKLTLLNQFHDVLPGSSIEIAYEDPLRFYKDIEKSGRQLELNAWSSIQKHLMSSKEHGQDLALSLFNSTCWTRKWEIIEVDLSALTHFNSNQFQQLNAAKDKGLIMVNSIPGMCFKTIPLLSATTAPVFVHETDESEEYSFESSSSFDGILIVSRDVSDLILVENEFLQVSFDSHGHLVSLYDKQLQRQVMAENSLGNRFVYFEDVPLFWDAWDVEIYHLEKGWPAQVGSLVVEESGPLRVVLSMSHAISKTSTLSQKIIISANSRKIEFDTIVDWNENRRMLKVEFPVNISHDYATYETQFGYIQRPTHFNNSWDVAKFEVCGHKFVDFSEFGYGVTLLNDCKYGFSVNDNLIRMSLLRSPKAPDEHCDIGKHHFKYALVTHQGSFDDSNAVQLGYEFNVPLLLLPTLIKDVEHVEQQFFRSSPFNLVLETVKFAEDSIGNKILLRLYEAYGGRGIGKIQTTLKVKKAYFCNILEDEREAIEFDESGAFIIPYTPFKIISLMIELQV